MSSEITDLEKSILATAVYYDLFDYPLTGFEIFLYLVKSYRLKPELQNLKPESQIHNSQFAILDSLDNSEYLKKHFDQEKGFYFLKGREGIVRQRLERKKIADRKWKKIKPVFKVLQIVPFVKFMMVSGSLAMGNSKKESDIDLIIVAKKGRIWTARTLVTLLTSVLGVRRRGNITEDKICLNHYITDQSLRIPFESLYNAQSYCHLISVYNACHSREGGNPLLSPYFVKSQAMNDKTSGNIEFRAKHGMAGNSDLKLCQDFQKANQWIKKYVCQYPKITLGNRRSVKRNKLYFYAAEFFEKILSGKAGDYFERRLGKWQARRIKNVGVRNVKTQNVGTQNFVSLRDGRITINENQLEFHPHSREAKIIPEFNKRMEKLGLLEFAGQKDSGLTFCSS